MKRDFGLIFHLFLIFGDACAVLLSFLVAYFMRTHLDQRPFYFESNPVSFVLSLAWLIPVYLILLAAFGLYRKSIFLSRSRWSEYGRLFLVSVIGVMAIITYGFCFNLDFFPVHAGVAEGDSLLGGCAGHGKQEKCGNKDFPFIHLVAIHCFFSKNARIPGLLPSLAQVCNFDYRHCR